MKKLISRVGFPARSLVYYFIVAISVAVDKFIGVFRSVFPNSKQGRSFLNNSFMYSNLPLAAISDVFRADSVAKTCVPPNATKVKLLSRQKYWLFSIGKPMEILLTPTGFYLVCFETALMYVEKDVNHNYMCICIKMLEVF